ncbi:MAG: YggT family protein [Myxococcota bacterium]
MSSFIELYCLLLVVDVLLAWVQEDPQQWPRQLTHWLTEPLLIPLRMMLAKLPLSGWDLSPAVLIIALTSLKLVLT